MASSDMLGNKNDKPSGPLEMLPKLNLSMGDSCSMEEKLAAEAVKISGEEKMLIKADKEYPTPPVSPPRSFGTGVCGYDLNETPEEIDEP
ncbi:hypothetical protein OsI_25994 [Oryza sativa Indica Group]|uniref:Uncharacterized protein n=1 Tax=Oryza sativa subsp. indica TaxID=39946 RepID=B8B608_ORYSI|nr:hypothetical protein OsI_25994 [Oryza sativa Indica Group]